MALRQVVKEKRATARKARTSGVQLGEDHARALILRGGAGVFAKHGARAASVEDILKASGVSRRTFYRFYASKEDVLVALYRLGTDDLLAACREVIASTPDPLLQIQGCIDAHLRNAHDLGRLVFVLGGEAQRHESGLHARRMEVHSELVSMLVQSASAWAVKSKANTVKTHAVDPLLYRGLILALEGVTRLVLEAGNEGRDVTDTAIERARAVMRRIATSTLNGQGPGVAPLPTIA